MVTRKILPNEFPAFGTTAKRRAGEECVEKGSTRTRGDDDVCVRRGARARSCARATRVVAIKIMFVDVAGIERAQASTCAGSASADGRRAPNPVKGRE